jgi:hypothetical protein
MACIKKELNNKKKGAEKSRSIKFQNIKSGEKIQFIKRK